MYTQINLPIVITQTHRTTNSQTYTHRSDSEEQHHGPPRAVRFGREEGGGEVLWQLKIIAHRNDTMVNMKIFYLMCCNQRIDDSKTSAHFITTKSSHTQLHACITCTLTTNSGGTPGMCVSICRHSSGMFTLEAKSSIRLLHLTKLDNDWIKVKSRIPKLQISRTCLQINVARLTRCRRLHRDSDQRGPWLRSWHNWGPLEAGM